MEDKVHDIFQFDAASFWEKIPQYDPNRYIQGVNQDTGEALLIPAKKLEADSEEKVFEQIDLFHRRYKKFRDEAHPELVEDTVEWLRNGSNLLHLVATQLASHLIDVYNHLLKTGFETKQLFKAGVPYFMLIIDKADNLIEIKLNLDEEGVADIIEHLEKLCSTGFDRTGTWQICAREVLAYLSVAALERMERELGEVAVENMTSEAWTAAFSGYLNAEKSVFAKEELPSLLQNSSQAIVQSFIKGLNLPNLSLADLDRLLGLSPGEFVESVPATEARLADSVLPMPTGAAFISAIQAQIRKDLWKTDSDGFAFFQQRAKGNPNNYIDHYITSPGDIEILPWEQAEQIIDKFGFNTVKLHLIFAAHTMNQPVPWEGKFSLKASDIVKYLGWDSRTDLPSYQKLNEIAKTAFVLDCLLVKSVWVEGRNKKGGINASTPTGRMWNVVVNPRGQLNLQGQVEKPEEVYITVQPGLIFHSFLNKAGNRLKEALYQFGYLAQDILKIDPYHDELALRLAIQLTMDSRVHATGKYQVRTLLEGMLPKATLEAARSDKRKGYDLKQRWDNALKLLLKLKWQVDFDESYPEWLRPGSEAPKPDDWRKVKVIDRLLAAKLVIQPPAPIPELLTSRESRTQARQLKSAATTKLTGDQIRRARESKKWSQRKLAGWLGVSDVLIGYWEKGKRTPASDMEVKLREMLQIQD